MRTDEHVDAVCLAVTHIHTERARMHYYLVRLYTSRTKRHTTKCTELSLPKFVRRDYIASGIKTAICFTVNIFRQLGFVGVCGRRDIAPYSGH